MSNVVDLSQKKVAVGQYIALPAKPWWPYPRSGEVLVGAAAKPLDRGRVPNEPSAGPLIMKSSDITLAQWQELLHLPPFGPRQYWGGLSLQERLELKDALRSRIDIAQAGRALPLCWERVLAFRDVILERMRASRTLTKQGADFE